MIGIRRGRRYVTALCAAGVLFILAISGVLVRRWSGGSSGMRQGPGKGRDTVALTITEAVDARLPNDVDPHMADPKVLLGFWVIPLQVPKRIVDRIDAGTIGPTMYLSGKFELALDNYGRFLATSSGISGMDFKAVGIGSIGFVFEPVIVSQVQTDEGWHVVGLVRIQMSKGATAEYQVRYEADIKSRRLEDGQYWLRHADVKWIWRGDEKATH